MKIVVTGAAGYVGSRVAEALLDENSPLPVTELVLLDTQLPRLRRQDSRVRAVALDVAAPGSVEKIIDNDCDILFHLAAIVSGHAEADFDLGLKVNFDATRELLEVARRKVPSLKFVFTSTTAVFGGNLPPIVDDLTAVTPQNSYGMAKAMSELLINDYSRKGFVDGRIVRLPAVSVRAGTANKAVTSFASGIVREPLNGQEAICPVVEDQEIWVTSPATVVRNIIHAATLRGKDFGAWRGVNLPGINVSVKEMVKALEVVAGKQYAAKVRFNYDESISRIVASFPTKFDTTRALALGFAVDDNYADIIRAYIRDDLKNKITVI